jgi:hypothetical protein
MLKKASRTEGQEFKTKIYAMHENKEQEYSLHRCHVLEFDFACIIVEEVS